MKEFIRKIYSKASGAKDLSMELNKMAAKKSAEYIYQKMLNAKPLQSDLEVLNYAANLSKSKGLALEFGVYTGGSINHLSSKFEKIYGFDSFDGLPESWHTNIEQGHFALNNLPKVNKNVELIKGLFDETLPNFFNFDYDEKFISFLHVDCDLYSSTVSVFKHCGKYLKKDSIIVFNEYFNYPGWEQGEFKAFQEFVTTNSIKYEYLCYNKNHEQVAVQLR